MARGIKKTIVRIILGFVLVGAIVGLAVVLKSQQSGPVKPGLIEVSPDIGLEPIVMSDYVRYPGQEGKTAFELLENVAEVGFKRYDFGVFVESINGVKPDEKHFWKLYYNGQESQVGADKLGTKYGDVVEWRLEEIQ